MPPGASLGVQAREPIPSFGPITWVDPAGDNDYNGLSVRLEHRFSRGLYFLNSFTWGKALGDSEQALEYFSGYVEANPQNIYNLAAERGPSSFDVKLNNVTSVVYELPFGKGRQFASIANPFVDAVIGGWELNSINTAHTGTAAERLLQPVGGQRRDRPFQRLSRRSVSAAQCIRQRVQPKHRADAQHLFRRIHVCDACRSSAPFGDLGRNAFRAPGFEQWDLGVDKNFRIHEDIRVQFRSEFFNITQQRQFRNTEHHQQQRFFWTDSQHLSGAADPVRAEAIVLTSISSRSSPLLFPAPSWLSWWTPWRTSPRFRSSS